MSDRAAVSDALLRSPSGSSGGAGANRSHEEADRNPEDAVEQARRWLVDHGLPVPEKDPPGAGGGGPGESPKGGRSPEGDHSLGGGSQSANSAWSTTHSTTSAELAMQPFPDGSDADPVAVARTIVLRKLAAQARTRAELSKALKAKAVPDDAAREVLDRMEEIGLIDDQSYARDWVESRQLRRHLSRSALRRELITKGVERDEIDVALEQVDSHDELVAARSLVTKKERSMEGLDRQVRYRRLAGMLGRRGFSHGVISQVLGDTLDREDG